MPADATMTSTDLGVYEINLSAGTQYQINTSAASGPVTVTLVKGTSPVYAKVAASVAVRDQAAVQIVPNGSATIATLGAALTFISATDAVVTVRK